MFQLAYRCSIAGKNECHVLEFLNRQIRDALLHLLDIYASCLRELPLPAEDPAHRD